MLKSSPQWIWQRFWGNAEFRLLVADRIQKYFFNDGLLTPAAAQARFMNRKEQIDRAVVGESARWGDAQRPDPLTRRDWLRMVNVITNNYFPRRTAIVLSQLKARRLYPDLAAPIFNQNGGIITNGFNLVISTAEGTAYYTLDGSDPRVIGGGLAPNAKAYNSPLPLRRDTVVHCRVLNGATWSAQSEAVFTVGPPNPNR